MLYEMSDEPGVKRVADSNQLLTQMLESLPSAIQHYFPEAHLALDVFRDPEEDVPEKINVRVCTQLTPSQAVAGRARMIEQWFVPFLKETGDVPVVFTMERLR